MFADGYSCKNSLPNCSMMWFGTTKIDLLHSPSLLLSIAPATISKVLPAPTSCAKRVFLPYNI